MSRTVAEVMVEVLAAAGAKRCYGVPGDTLNYFTDAIRKSEIRWVHTRHEEAAAFAAGADALLTDQLTLCAGSCGPGSLHFINGLYESHRNRAPVVLIASQIVRDELSFDFPQEVDFKSVYKAGSVFCEEIRTPEQARRMTAMAAQAALARRGAVVRRWSICARPRLRSRNRPGRPMELTTRLRSIHSTWSRPSRATRGPRRSTRPMAARRWSGACAMCRPRARTGRSSV
jgi:hypothetical protein